ncbi:MAG: prolipoprotein diacylglyceryl transferase [Clostridia bacterium]|nr:prolipoprotein diacylglyceryl transferase [Clostridia bacterium]
MGGNQFTSSDVNEVRFPGLFGDFAFTLNKVAFKIGDITIYWYGVIICFGIICSFIYFYNRSKRTELIPENDILNVTLFTIPIGVVCARLLYVLTNLEDYTTFKSIIAVNNGGLAIYGGIIGGMATIIIYCRIRKIPVFKVLDAAAPAVMIGQLIGRWGNFVNCEAYGYLENDSVLPNLPWRMQITSTETGNSLTVHPTFLYESLWNLIGFVIVNIIYKKKKFNGQIAFFYIGWYGLGRAFIEFLRADSLLIFGQKMFVYLGFLCFAVSLILYLVLRSKSKKEPDELEEYKKAYQTAQSQATPEAQAAPEAQTASEAMQAAPEAQATPEVMQEAPEETNTATAEEKTENGDNENGDNT